MQASRSRIGATRSTPRFTVWRRTGRLRNASCHLFDKVIQPTLTFSRGPAQQQQCCSPSRTITMMSAPQSPSPTEYTNFSHERMTIETTESTIPVQNLSKDQLIFGKQFTPHMLQIQYTNKQWSAPKIVPYQNLSISPAASGLHYGS
jgi:hypothetical protein